MKDTGCAAAWCRNSSSKGFKMNYFPRKEERRNAWIKNVNRTNWSPTRRSALCEEHFAPDMWEKIRVDGEKKLKSCAIPTIFVRNKTQLLLNRKKHENNGKIRRTNILNSITLLQRKSRHSIKRGDESQSECNKKLYRSKETNSKQITGNNKNLYQNNIESSALKEKRLEKNISESLSAGVKMTKTISNSTDNRYILKIKINKIHKTH